MVPQKEIGPELNFIISYLLSDRLGIDDIDLVYHENPFYSLLNDSQEVFRFPSSSFFADINDYLTLKKEAHFVGNAYEWQLFPSDNEEVFNFNFDLFAACFYLIARIDELLPNAQFDKHNRFKIESSIQYKGNVHELPIVDFWVKQLRTALEKEGVKILKKENFEWWNTIDIDQVYASKGKPLLKRLGAIGKKVSKAKFGEALLLGETFFGKKDPFDVLDFVFSTKSRDILFFLCGGTSIYDNADTRNHSSINHLISTWKHRFEIGLHPSYNSFNNKTFIEHEKSLAEEWIQREVNFSRQHYLHYQWPSTPKLLQASGISHDFTMGYANAIGFRAGTSRPFAMYDIKQRKQIPITIVPFCIMDVTLRFYMNLTPNQAYEKIAKLIANIRACNGLYISLWHNESLSEIDGWKGWRDLFLRMKADLTK